MVLALLRARAPEADRVARLCKMYGVPDYDRFASNPGEKCILCGLCVKACQSLGTGAIAAVNRGVDKYRSPVSGKMIMIALPAFSERFAI